jgi:hypothetical protein
MTLDQLKNDVVVFDIDGVLAKYNFPKFERKIFSTDEWISMNMSSNPYEQIERVTFFDNFMNEMDCNRLYTLSETFTSDEQWNKTAFIKDNFPIREDNIIFVGNKQFKVNVLKEIRKWHEKEGRRVTLIEDNVEVLASVERLDDKNIRCITISEFL